MLVQAGLGEAAGGCPTPLCWGIVQLLIQDLTLASISPCLPQIRSECVRWPEVRTCVTAWSLWLCVHSHGLEGGATCVTVWKYVILYVYMCHQAVTAHGSCARVCL